MVMDVVGRELRREAAPGEAEARSDHRDRRHAPPGRGQQVRSHREDAEPHEHERQHEVVGVRGAAFRRGQRDPHHTHDDREHREVLAPAGMLVEHPLRREHEHDQARGERRLDHHERGEQQRDDLQRPAHDGHRRAELPARFAQQPPGERGSQMLIVGRLLGLGGLEGDT
jgi:hypothetical protein